MFVRKVLTLVHTSDTMTWIRVASTALLQKLLTLTDLEFEISYFKSRKGIIGGFKLLWKNDVKENLARRLGFEVPLYLQIFGEVREVCHWGTQIFIWGFPLTCGAPYTNLPDASSVHIQTILQCLMLIIYMDVAQEHVFIQYGFGFFDIWFTFWHHAH